MYTWDFKIFLHVSIKRRNSLIRPIGLVMIMIYFFSSLITTPILYNRGGQKVKRQIHVDTCDIILICNVEFGILCFYDDKVFGHIFGQIIRFPNCIYATMTSIIWNLLRFRHLLRNLRDRMRLLYVSIRYQLYYHVVICITVCEYIIIWM